MLRKLKEMIFGKQEPREVYGPAVFHNDTNNKPSPKLYGPKAPSDEQPFVVAYGPPLWEKEEE